MDRAASAVWGWEWVSRQPSGLPSGTLVLAWPSLEQGRGGRHGAALSPHRSCWTKAFSTQEGLDSTFGAEAE